MKGCIVPYLDKTKSREAAEDGSDGGRNLEVTAVTVYLTGWSGPKPDAATVISQGNE